MLTPPALWWIFPSISKALANLCQELTGIAECTSQAIKISGSRLFWRSTNIRYLSYVLGRQKDPQRRQIEKLMPPVCNNAGRINADPPVAGNFCCVVCFTLYQQETPMLPRARLDLACRIKKRQGNSVGEVLLRFQLLRLPSFQQSYKPKFGYA